MILVLANRYDQGAAALVDRWQSVGARLILPEMLSDLGFGFRSGGRERPQALSAIEMDSLKVGGVLVRMNSVHRSDITHIRAGDRDYVAMEMTAFLRAWLSVLPCRVLGRPTTMSLSGPLLRPEQWLHIAATAGVPILPARRSTRLSPSKEAVHMATDVVTIAGDHCIGARTKALAERAITVAKASGADLVAMYFGGSPDDPALVHADPWVDLYDPAVENAIHSFFSGNTHKKEVAP